MNSGFIFWLSVWINRIGGHAPIPLKLKLFVFLFCLTHRVAIKVSHSAAASNANDCSHSVIDSRKFSVGLCIQSNPHATMRKNFKHKNPLLMSQRIITGVEWGTREPPLLSPRFFATFAPAVAKT